MPTDIHTADSHRPEASGVEPQQDEAPVHHGGPPPSAQDAAPSARPQLTHRQQNILRYIKEAVEVQGYPPTQREIAAAVGLAGTSSVGHQLKQLGKKGYLAFDPYRPRSLRIVESGAADSAIPVPADVGCPSRADDAGTEPMGTFVLRASLDPALMDALLSGALVTVKHWPTAGTGSTSAVLGQVIAVTHPLNGHAQRVAP